MRIHYKTYKLQQHVTQCLVTITLYLKYDRSVKTHNHLEFTVFFGWFAFKTFISVLSENLR